MPRNMRLFVPYGYYHVYCRVARGEFIFEESAEVDRWIDLVAFVLRLHDLRCLAWSLMTNHYHLCIQAGAMPLSAAMCRLQGRFSKQYNRRRGLRGRLWQSRYKTKLLLDDEHVKHVIAYVHLNPVAARIVDDPMDYPSSGHREVMGLRGSSCATWKQLSAASTVTGPSLASSTRTGYGPLPKRGGSELVCATFHGGGRCATTSRRWTTTKLPRRRGTSKDSRRLPGSGAGRRCLSCSRHWNANRI